VKVKGNKKNGSKQLVFKIKNIPESKGGAQ